MMAGLLSRRAMTLALGAALAAGEAWATTAADVCAPAANPCLLSRTIVVTSGSVLDFGTRALELRQGGVLDVRGGAMTISAGSLRLVPGAALLGRGGATGGSITVRTTGAITVEAAGTTRARIDVAADTTAGGVLLDADGDVTIGGTIVAKSNTMAGSGGAVTVAGAAVTTSGEITVAGGGQGQGGEVTIRATGPMVIGGPVDASGGNLSGGGNITLEGQGDVTTTARLDVGVRNGSADAGAVTVSSALGSVSVQGQITGQGLCSDTLGCVSTGADLTISAGRSVVVGAQMDLSGGGPDGIGGDAFIDAGTVDDALAADVLLNAPLLTLGKGVDGLGGDVFVTAKRDVSVALIDTSGGSDGGGTVSVEAGGTIAVPGEVNADTRTSGVGGDVVLGGLASPALDVADRITVSGNIHASGTGTGAAAGAILLEACDVTVAAGAQVTTRGPAGGNFVSASGRATLGGAFASGVGASGAEGVNEIRYWDIAKPPTILASATFVPPRRQIRDGTLPACTPPPPAGCGNGVVEPGETCDDGNTTPCDGCSATCRVDGCGSGTVECGEECDDGNRTACDDCSPTCRLEGCGNGIVECGEQCDEGAQNGVPDGLCTANCRLAPPPGCGDGAVGEGEECDGGNTEPCDGCSSICRLEGCSNGVVECLEECDDLNTTGCDGCSADCREERCGDGIAECEEECDEGAANGSPGASCDTRCRRPIVCGTDGAPEYCIPCAGDLDCDPFGRCGGRFCDVDGICTSVPPLDCDDSDPLTIDRCVLDPAGAPRCEHECLAAAACDDGNPCTDDVCDAGGLCMHAPRQGVAAIACRLDVVEQAVANAGDGELSPALAARIGKRIGKLRGRLDTAAAAETAGKARRERRVLRGAGRLVKKLARVVAKGQRRGEVSDALADTLSVAIGVLDGALREVRAGLKPPRRS